MNKIYDGLTVETYCEKQNGCVKHPFCTDFGCLDFELGLLNELSDLQEYVNLIGDEGLKYIVTTELNRGVKYLKLPSSSTGFHHPKDELHEWGQKIHIKKVFNLALWGFRKELYPNTQIKRDDLDHLLAATLLHDLPNKFYFCEDEQKYKINKNHAIDNAIYYLEQYGIKIEKVAYLIAYHMGRWGDYSDKRYKKIEKLRCGHIIKLLMRDCIHEADYYASRPNILIDPTMLGNSFDSNIALYDSIVKDLREAHNNV